MTVDLLKIEVLLFARYRDVAGSGSIAVEVPRGATLSQVWGLVQAKVPALRAETRPLLALDRSYAQPDQVVAEGVEIAAFPPVSGG